MSESNQFLASSTDRRNSSPGFEPVFPKYTTFGRKTLKDNQSFSDN